MTRSRAGTILILVTWAGCQGDMLARKSGPSSQPDSGTTSPIPPGDPVADQYKPCTDLNSCCTKEEMVCKGDLDNGNVICGCSKLWDCSLNPKKCEQDKPAPSEDGNWTCSWSEDKYVCTGGSTPNPVDGWICSTENGVTTCTKTPPNPSNQPGGTSVWSCVVDNAQNKVKCERHEPTTPQPEPNPNPNPNPNPTPTTEDNCADGIDNDGDGQVDCADSDCPACQETCPAGQECCDGIDNNGDGRVDEGNVCGNVETNEPCPPGAVQSCDCYCGVHRKCQADGTWGPCIVDGNNSCQMAQITSQSQCGFGQYCDYGECVWGILIASQCKHHNDCPTGKVCDLGQCVNDPYSPCP